MPHEIRELAMTIVVKSANVVATTGEWELILSWCVLAAQQEESASSLLALSVEAVTERDDEYFSKWIDQRLDSTLGPHPTMRPQGNIGVEGTFHHHDPTQVSAMMATEVGKGVALGLRAMGHLQRDTPQLGGGDKGDTSKGYTKDDIAAIMGFAGVYSGNSLPDIWELFSATKGKNINAYRRHLFARMKNYAYDRRIQINTSIYLEQETIKAIVELHFNPGEGVAHLALASKGLSILACRARTT
jgi:hypothetical protein